FLSGSASQDFVEYAPGWTGRLRILADAARTFHLQYPRVLGAALVVGAVQTVGRARHVPRDRRGGYLAVALLPLLVAVSFTVMFNFAARRTNARFLMPQALVLAVYGGIAIEHLAFGWSARILRALGKLTVGVALAFALYVCASVDATLLGDPRYAAESWLAANVRPGETVETYGLNVYMPRMPAHARVLRVGPEPISKRNPMPGVEEVQAPFREARSRGTRWIVVSVGWVWRYIARWPKIDPGHQRAPLFERSTADREATDFFDGLVAGDQGYKLVREFVYDDSMFRLVDVHGASGKIIWVYERTAE
ncbi:MAG TPA: hypothetical protein VM925_26150, partial [Labilithrix sp.]|nr:hypothetical protein [Labilithrix sp.]